MTKKERVINAIQFKDVDAVPSSFSLHFEKDKAFGDEAVKSHLDFFKSTDTDILKIMNENLVPCYGKINCANDYKEVQKVSSNDSFFKDQIELTKKIINKCEKDAFTIGTLHGITASAIHPIEKSGVDYDSARKLLVSILRENENIVIDSIKKITEVMIKLAEKYIELGLDAVYYASLGGEPSYFTDEEFDKWIKPFDIEIMKSIKNKGGYCFLHICKNDLNMNRYKDYNDYCDVVNWGVYEVPYTIEEGKKLFPNKTIMGGLANRKGVLVNGTDDEVEKEVNNIIDNNGSKGFILGADCTLDTYQDLNKVHKAVITARNYFNK